ncbi:MAG: response regulator [Elusimicrobiota bacterium]|jgi:CheY-like chemotaxis protein
MKKILVVDDERLLREILVRRLKLEGYAVFSAGSAEEALDLLKKETVDAVLLDNVLPGMSGLQALEALFRESSAPVVLMTGHFDDDFRTDAMLLGAFAVLSKPLDDAALCDCLAKASGR